MWGSADVYVSDDGSTYDFAGTVTRGRWGTITSSISNSVTTIPVDLSVSGGTLDSTSATGASDDLTAMWLNNEVFSYETATLTGTNAYSLTNCLRGRMSTTPAAHTSGDTVVRLDEGVFKHTIAHNRLGTTIYFKLVSRNRYGGAQQSIADVSPYTYNIPSNPAILPSPSAVTVAISSTPAP